MPPAPDAVGGTVHLQRGAWVAKYDPTRAERERQLDPTERDVEHSDVFADFSWDDPTTAIGEPWIHSWLMRGAGVAIPRMDVGDLVFPMRTNHVDTDSGWLRRRALIGVWFVDSITTWPEQAANGGIAWYSDVACFPLRRFDFPVPVEAMEDIDLDFANVSAFHDRSRKAIVELDAAEALAVTRACGLPAAILTEPDPDRLAPAVANLDLGPPSMVRKRILDGARAAAHRSSVEKAARDVVVGRLRRVRMAVVSTEKERGLGSDLWAKAVESDGSVTEVRVEVKGLSGADPWRARLTRSEVEAARAAAGTGGWRLAIVTRALRADRRDRWLSAEETAAVFTVHTDDGHFTADPAAAAAL